MSGGVCVMYVLDVLYVYVLGVGIYMGGWMGVCMLCLVWVFTWVGG